MLDCKDYRISFCRFIAMIFVFSCHILQFFNNDLCWWLNVGVQLFLVISGYLYSFKTIENINSFYKKNFMKILIPYLIFILFALFFFYYFKGVSMIVCIRTLFFKQKIAGLGHLWFIPLILFCYFITPFLRNMLERENNVFALMLRLFLVFLFTDYIVRTFFYYFNPAWVNCYIIGLGYGYLTKCCKVKLLNRFFSPIVILFSIILGSIIVFDLFNCSLLPFYNILFDYCHVLLGFSIFLVLITVVKTDYIGEIVSRGLDISDKYCYYVYLTHHFFILRSF